MGQRETPLMFQNEINIIIKNTAGKKILCQKINIKYIMILVSHFSQGARKMTLIIKIFSYENNKINVGYSNYLFL